MKAQGAAQIFLDTHPEVSDSITYKNLEKLLKDRFQGKHSDFYNYTQLQAAKQEKDETLDDFADRLRKLSRNTLHIVRVTIYRSLPISLHQAFLCIYFPSLFGVITVLEY